jgi:hypothetical protein
MTTREEAIIKILALMEKSNQLHAESLSKGAEANRAAHEAGRLSDEANLSWDDIHAVVEVAHRYSDTTMNADLSNVAPQSDGTFVFHNYDGRPIFQTKIPIHDVAEILDDLKRADAA